MTKFDSWRSYYDFSRTVMNESRYLQPSNIKSFLDTLLSTSDSRKEVMEEGYVLWRAQLGCDFKAFYQNNAYVDDFPSPFPEDRMRPLKDQAREGRANPKGIPYLYLASKRDTAMLEARPWLGSIISVARFHTSKQLNIVNCTNDKSNSVWLIEPNDQEKEKSVWSDINKSFSTPVTNNDSTADYIPTQILSEAFKNHGFDGVAYGSSLGEGFNIVLFNIKNAEYVHCAIEEVKKIEFEFNKASSPYQIRK